MLFLFFSTCFLNFLLISSLAYRLFRTVSLTFQIFGIFLKIIFPDDFLNFIHTLNEFYLLKYTEKKFCGQVYVYPGKKVLCALGNMHYAILKDMF